MALAGRIRSALPLLTKALRTYPLPAQRSALALSNSQFSRSYATPTGKKEEKVKTPLALFGGSGNYASALYLAAVKSSALDKVEEELLALVEAIKKSTTFAQFTKDPSVPADIRLKAIQQICEEAKFSEVTKGFLAVLAANGRLRYVDSIAKKFTDLTMAHKGEVKAVVITVIPLPAEEEKELRETLQEVIGRGKTVKIEQKIDPSILGGLVVEFGQKVFDMSIRTRARQMERFLREPVNFGNL
ncbi:ATP synthase subunit O, mitochondrial [Morella rubra]|uniref:ATP synthase subunit O, mitochondrial n=1 Tax=Morella rubra TaxID=262757 RepID=A0A6A1WHC7_9ROSI|nr:ATP synthase subunit O, mitochondrial [Morella rubra]